MTMLNIQESSIKIIQELGGNIGGVILRFKYLLRKSNTYCSKELVLHSMWWAASKNTQYLNTETEVSSKAHVNVNIF